MQRTRLQWVPAAIVGVMSTVLCAAPFVGLRPDPVPEMAEGLRVRGGKRVTLGRDNGQLGRKSFSQLVVRALPEGSRQNYSLEVHFDDARFKDSGGSWRDGGRAFFLRLADRPEYCFTIKAGGLKEASGPLCCCLPFCCSPFAAAGSKSLGVHDTVCVFYNFRGANQVFK